MNIYLTSYIDDDGIKYAGPDIMARNLRDAWTMLFIIGRIDRLPYKLEGRLLERCN